MKLRKKYSISWIAISLCCILVLIPVICSVVYFNSIVSARLETTARETASFYVNQYANETSAIMDTLRNSVYYLTSDERTQTLMQQEDMPGQMERLAVEEGLSRMFLLGKIPDSTVVTGIYLIKDEEQYLSILRSGIFQGTVSRMKEIYRDCGDYNSARDLYTHPAYPDYCYLIVDYLELDTMDTLGKIIIELNSSQFINSSNIDTIYQQAVVQLCSTSGTLITGKGNGDFSGIPHSSTGEYLTIDEETYYHTSRILTPSNLQIALFIPKQEIFETINATTKISFIFTFIVLMITLFMGIIMFYFVFKPLKQLLFKLASLADGDLNVRMESTPYTETDQIASSFNNMTDRLKELFDEVYNKGLLLREAEFNLLESQIHPHFLFNILELINMRCLASGQNDICHIVSNLAKLLRSNITHKHQQIITFEDELQYVRYYLELQKERFAEKLSYTIDMEDTIINQYFLPKLSIQPLVENSIVHGLENKREGGWVHIFIWEEVDSVCVHISDNGIGFDVDSIDLNTTPSAEPDARHNHVALININRRIQLLFGEAYGMSITSASGKGTQILLTLPVMTSLE